MSPANQYVHDAIFWALAITVTVFGFAGAVKDGDLARRAHLVGWATMVATFFGLAGPEAVAPHFERYALVLVAPTILTFVVLLGHAAEQWKMRRHVLTMGAVLAALCLVSFHINYVHVLAISGGDSHRTFRTSGDEPKATAIDRIRSRRSDGANCAEMRIVAEDWWTYWPLLYRAYREPGLAVIMTSRETVEQFFGNMDGCSYLVGFAGGPFESVVAERNVPLDREAINDPLNRPILLVWRNR
jgi:hypothetical protein